MTQLNTPYPATAYLQSFLKQKGVDVAQSDLSLELALRIFSKQGLSRIHSECLKIPVKSRSELLQFFIENFKLYQGHIENVIKLLQGKDNCAATLISERRVLPEGPRFEYLHEYEEQILKPLGEHSIIDRARFFSSHFIEDIVDVIREVIDPRFELARFGESLASSQISFDVLYESVTTCHSLIDEMMFEALEENLEIHNPDVIGFTVPFPGNMYAALKLGWYLKDNHPKAVRVMGGGFVNTELRELSDKRFFEFVDYLTFDDGETPLEYLLQFIAGKKSQENLLRTWFLKEKNIFKSPHQEKKADIKSIDVSFKDLKGPDFAGLDFTNYIPMFETTNPMMRMWFDFKWNKMILAHGCYWKKCSFCDVNLDYIGRFEPQKATQLVDQMESIISQTGMTGFHFVDEAAPPALLKAISKEIISRNLKVTWWGNLRFDVQFDSELTELMSRAGCVAVTGGIEVASERLLKLINKGIRLDQVAQVTKAFSESGIWVHAYLMYGFPTQTVQETVDSLEVVRQLFEQKCLHSGHWSRLIVTPYSPIGKDPDRFGVQLHPYKEPKNGVFSKYEIPFTEKTKVDHEKLGQGLKKAIYNYMHGQALEVEAHKWFEGRTPKTSHPLGLIKAYLAKQG